MADLDDIENIAGSVISYSLFNRLVNRYGLLNVLFYGALSLVIALFLIIQLFVWIFNNGYEDTWDKVKPGDKLYAEKRVVTDTASRMVFLFRLIRPINSDDIDRMKIAEWKKDKLKMKIDSSLKSKMLTAPGIFYQDSLLKYKTGFLGTYIKKDSVEEYGGFGQHWYAIKPNFKLIRKHYLKFEMPAGYTLADSDYYISAQDGKFNEIDLFTTKK
ncbi:hypothetical protein [Mucilaginibacter pocheonensis]|uniref:Uncharacterized protein n=1 Tax=Mucilaginibacter pocheonensis TaxID=398050 RepID=A0ABU1TH02_9SPHI|nr:hypothetical protein [Mucilaginibacter pocheonensis]MDR6944691.1 hypothetical protein [Mucilaginibacter pocheonensis]